MKERKRVKAQWEIVRLHKNSQTMNLISPSRWTDLEREKYGSNQKTVQCEVPY